MYKVRSFKTIQETTDFIESLPMYCTVTHITGLDGPDGRYIMVIIDQPPPDNTTSER